VKTNCSLYLLSDPKRKVYYMQTIQITLSLVLYSKRGKEYVHDLKQLMEYYAVYALFFPHIAA